MYFEECKFAIVKNLERYHEATLIKGIKALLFNASFKITFWFRIGSYLKEKKGLIFKLLYWFVFIAYKKNQYKTGIQLPFGTQIGRGLVFAHFSCIVINSGSKIGINCKIFQGVTIGSKRGENGGSPIIGDNVVISAGAKIIGMVKIGNNVMIGANSVVVSDIPDNAVAAGNPAKVVNMNGKYHTDLYLKN